MLSPPSLYTSYLGRGFKKLIFQKSFPLLKNNRYVFFNLKKANRKRRSIMKHIHVLFIKFVASLIVFWVSLDLFFDATIVDILSFSILLTVVSYFIGDQILLPRIGNLNSVIVDFFLTYLIVWIFGGILFESYLQVAWGSIISAILIAGSEVFVHSYILRTIKPTVQERHQSFNQRFAYEFAEDQEPKSKKEK